MYVNRSGKSGHPNVDVILMFKIQLLEVWYNLSDLAVEREIYDRLSFWHFLGILTKYLTIQRYGYFGSVCLNQALTHWFGRSFRGNLT